ncbi:MAG: patatin-like phospholipase family protein [Bacteroidetes bacterium]|uniref:Patatin-like phospholipase family protein n=1 Tax=Candidatus Cryptobacteroides intestinigallinarum TaxID=2840767 RepID=A0A9D9HJK4_9BACT|nr:patatin-like phospholipase family protein [Candidatus Cryptobacteroides intestinigallinarum]
MKKNVALVLSSGGPRGFAYIGAIEELLDRGYNITSVAGTSIGSLIGGMYAAGKLPEIKQWLFSLGVWKVFTLMDITVSMNHLVNGDRIIKAMKEIVPDVNIEDLDIPYKAVATDFYTGEEVIFDKGNLYQAIRASISIPSLFRPVKYGYRTLIDGGIANTMPMDRVTRTEGDIMVAIDVNDVNVDRIRQILIDDAEKETRKEEEDKASAAMTKTVIDSVRHNGSLTFMEKLRLARDEGYRLMKHMTERSPEQDDLLDEERNYFSLLSRTFSLMNHVNTKLALKITRPDILVSMPFDDFGAISDYAKAEEISEAGRIKMKEALDAYEASGSSSTADRKA